MDLSLFKNEFAAEKLLYNEPMSNYTSFKIGGPADLIVFPETKEEIQKAIWICKEKGFPYFIMGKGSNLLVKDAGYRGVVIALCKNYEDITLLDKNSIYAGAGVTLSKLAGFAMDNSLAGLEFASGIPGSLGGAVFMNAGAYDGEMKDVITSVDLLDENGNEISKTNEEMGFGYRTSIIQKNDGKYIVLGANLKLEAGDSAQIKTKSLELNKRRKDKQPLDLPSAGSTFKRPEGYFAAKLIDDAGLKGLSSGGAMVSEKHCGFIVNFNKATADDVITLIEMVKEKVYKQFSIELEAEIRIIGD